VIRPLRSQIAFWLLLPAIPACTTDSWLRPDAGSSPDGASLAHAKDASSPADPSSLPDATSFPEIDALVTIEGDGSIASDASSSDASVPGSDTGAVTMGANASKCPGSAFPLCDDFESGMIDPSTWTMAPDNGGGGTLAVDTTRAYRGTHALHVHLPSGASGQSANARLVETRTFPALQNGMYGRVFVYLVGTPPGKHTPFVAAQQNSPSNVYYGTEEKNGGSMYAVQGAPGIDEGFGSATQIGVGKWTCLEWYYGGMEIRTWLDGTELTDIKETNWTSATFQEVLLGLADEDLSTIGSGGFDVWFDEVAIDSAAIGCDN
jgi:hypothetical protein